ncbi:MAG: FAD-binding protein, partial [Gemmatimonadota bacterium]
MPRFAIRTLDDGQTTLDDSTVEAFVTGLRGGVLTLDDAEYDGARAMWNGMIDRRPALIVRCAGAADVRRAVDLARDHGLLTSVRGGGHNIAGHAVC